MMLKISILQLLVIINVYSRSRVIPDEYQQKAARTAYTNAFAHITSTIMFQRRSTIVEVST